MDKNYDLVIIGGGASGMMAALVAVENGAKVLVLEKNDKLGKKLSITGGGRCNILNAEFDTKKLLENFPQSKKHLYSPFSVFSSEEAYNFFESRGLPLVTEARKRAFPASQKAADVTSFFVKKLRASGVDILLNSPTLSIKKKEDEIESLKLKGGKKITGKNFLIATGGKAAPQTGSTGDGFNFLRSLNLDVADPSPNVVPLKTSEEILHNISGLSIDYTRVRFIQGQKTKISKTGKILFTHFGLSAPLILNSSYEVLELLKKGEVEVSIDLFPDNQEPELDKKLLKVFEENKNKKIKNCLPSLIDKSLSEAVLGIVKKDGADLADKTTNSISKEERKILVKKLKDIRTQITGSLSLDKAVIVDGGLDLDQVDFKTMKVKKYKNLFVSGDILNINRPSGGFSLQLCWTTGFIIGSYFKK